MELQQKIQACRTATKTDQTIFITMVTTYGLKQNDIAGQFVDSSVILTDLF
jgi:hypothetical protein